MKKLFYTLFFTGIISLFNCKNGEQSISYDLKRTKEIKLSQVFNVTKTIKIKYHKPMPPIKLLKHIESYYIAYVSGNLCKINEKGEVFERLITKENKFLFKGITSFDIHSNRIYTVERSIQRIKIFKNNFELEKEYLLPFYPLAFKVISDDKILFYLGFQSSSIFKHQVVLYDLVNEKIIESFFEVPDNLNYFNIFTIDNFIEESNNVYFSNGMDNIVYKYNDNSVKPEIEFNYGSKSLPKDFYSTSKFSDIEEYMNYANEISAVSRHYSLRKYENYVLKKVSFGKERLFSLKNIKTNQEYTTSLIKDDITHSGEISSLDEENSFLGQVGDKFAIYLENSNMSRDSTHVGTLLFGNFKF